MRQASLRRAPALRHREAATLWIFWEDLTWDPLRQRPQAPVTTVVVAAISLISWAAARPLRPLRLVEETCLETCLETSAVLSLNSSPHHSSSPWAVSHFLSSFSLRPCADACAGLDDLLGGLSSPSQPTPPAAVDPLAALMGSSQPSQPQAQAQGGVSFVAYQDEAVVIKFSPRRNADQSKCDVTSWACHMMPLLTCVQQLTS